MEPSQRRREGGCVASLNRIEVATRPPQRSIGGVSCSQPNRVEVAVWPPLNFCFYFLFIFSYFENNSKILLLFRNSKTLNMHVKSLSNNFLMWTHRQYFPNVSLETSFHFSLLQKTILKMQYKSTLQKLYQT